ncbi:MAG TPA: FtsX-like permease family protein [Acidimicrobiia bacterium]|jgi:putative ABC transport system permease protein
MAVTGTLARRGLLANKWRLALTALAVVLGVSFVSGSFMLRDSLNTAFSDLVTQANHGIDAQVRTKLLFGDNTARNPVPPQLLTQVQHVDGVAAAAGTVGQVPVTIIGKNGKAKTPGAAPTIGLAWINDSKLTSLHLAAGRRPHGTGEVAVDKTAAKKTGYSIGQSIRVVLPTGARNFRLVGTFKFGTSDSLAGAYLVGFDPTVASQLLGLHGFYEAIDARAVPGVSSQELASRLNAILPHGYEAIDNAKLNQEAKDNFGFINAIATGLLAFALIALFVSGFIINNTFAILASQRLRELGLLRALGSSARQVRVLMFVEALVVGVTASIVGIGAGVLIELGIRALISALGGGLPGTFVLTPTPIIWGFAVGIVVTMAAALTPAFRAGRIPPVAAMSAEHTASAHESKWRLVIPAAFAVIGVVAFIVGLFARPGGTAQWLTLAGVGAALLFVGVAGLARLVVRPVLVGVSAVLRPIARIVSYPFTVGMQRARQRIIGQIARDNTSRTPRRTSAAAAALMIGLAFVTVGSVLGASIKQTLRNQLHTSIRADLFIQDKSNFEGMPSTVTAGIAKVPGVTDVSGFRGGSFKYTDSEKSALFADHTTAEKLLDIDLKSGSWSGLGLNKVFVYTDPAKEHHLHVGSTMPVQFPSGQRRTLTVAGVYGDSSIVGNYLLDVSTYEQNFTGVALDQFAGARVEPGQSVNAVKDSVATYLASADPSVTVQNRQEFQQSQENQVNQFFVLINSLLFLAVVIALIGIANTLALSVFERTRELGLMRAVGMARTQTKSMVRWESVLIAVFGALLGIVLGIVLGVLVAGALPSAVVSAVSIPGGQLLGYVVLAIVAGTIAAYFPARRAAKMNVLAAIATE